jgi:hypothetical protein
MAWLVNLRTELLDGITTIVGELEMTLADLWNTCLMFQLDGRIRRIDPDGAVTA